MEKEQMEERRRKSGPKIKLREEAKEPLLKPISTREAAPAVSDLEQPLVGRAKSEGGAVVRMKVYFPTAAGGKDTAVKSIQDVMIRTDKVR